MADHLDALRLFARVARKGSFSAVGRELGIPQSTVSRTIAALERTIGAALIVRTTRAVVPTEAGADFLARLEPILAELDLAEHATRETGELRGTLRVTLGSSLAVREVIPLLPGFLGRQPSLQLDLVIEDQRPNLVTEGMDLALRFGALPDSSATARLIKTWPVVLVTSPTYLATAGPPRAPTDLHAHSVILGSVGGQGDWIFRKDGAVTSLRLTGRLRIGGNEGAIAAAVAGLGITMTTSGACRRELESGMLVQILADWDLGSSELHAIFVSGRAAKQAAHGFVEHLINYFRVG